VTSEKFVLWKSNKKVLVCQRISVDWPRNVSGKSTSDAGETELFTEIAERADNSVGYGALEKFAEGIAERKDLSKVVGGEIGASNFWVGAFAADLKHADNAITGENWGADDFLDDFSGFGGQLDAFKYAGMLDRGKIVDDFRSVVAGGAGGERGLTRKRDKPDIF
jgi:hypothetical protein